MEHKKKVYLAGPDVFEHDAIARGKKYVKIAKEKGLIGLYPLDNEIDPNSENPDYEIFCVNKELLDSADYVVANLSDFRGHEPDSGTVWEVAYAIGKGKKVVGYINDSDPMLIRIAKKEGMNNLKKEGEVYKDAQGRHIENFGNPLNLMLQHSLHSVVHGTIADAFDEINKIIEAEKRQIEENKKKFKTK